MSVAHQTQAPKSNWNPALIRRQVREVATVAEIHMGKTYSWTNQDDVWHPIIDTATGECTCDCPDYIYRKGPKGQTCKHIDRLAEQLTRKAKEAHRAMVAKAAAWPTTPTDWNTTPRIERHEEI